MPAPKILSSRFRPFIGRFLLLCVCASTFLSVASSAGAPHLLNASFDVSREFYADYNLLFTKQFHQKTGVLARVYQSHAGSSKQARAVLEGFPADVVTMNQPLDIEMIAREDSRLIARDWRSRFQWDSSPCTTTVVFLVRAGNPKKICDWNDLVREGVQIVIASPKTSGNGRYAYLAAWGYAAQGSAGVERAFMEAIFGNVPTLDTGSRGATTTFTQRGIGDVLVSFESEILTTLAEAGPGKYEMVYPSLSIEAEMPVALVDRVVDRRGTRELATAYLKYLYSEAAQELMAEHGFRPRMPVVAEKHAAKFRKVPMLTVNEDFGGWTEAQRAHFSEGGTFDQVQEALRKRR